MRVLRVSHGDRDPQQRGRDRALHTAGADLTLVVPDHWTDHAAESTLATEPFRVVELPVRRVGDMNRHGYSDRAVRRVLAEARPEIIDIHAEPFSSVARQWMRAADPGIPVVMYTAQNVDKRFPPPFSLYERAALRRVRAFYPCSMQAASVIRGKGFGGIIEVLPLGLDPSVFFGGSQRLDAGELQLLLVGRLVPEKGGSDALEVLARVSALRPARLVVCGSGPDSGRISEQANALGLAGRVELRPWASARELASLYRAAHFVLVPSRPTTRWAEQFGRVIVEAQACGAVVIAYDNGAISEAAGEAGVLISTSNVEAMASAASALADDPGEFVRRRRIGIRQAADLVWERVAKRQVQLYSAALVASREPVALPASPRRRRAAASAEFGATAALTGGARPFALPILRRGGAIPKLLGWMCDEAAELAARI